MKPKVRRSILTLAILTSLAGGGLAFARLTGGTAAPAAEVTGWKGLAQAGAEIVEDKGPFHVEKVFPESLRAAAEGYRVEGYVVPVVPEPWMSTLLLVEQPEDCPFCGSNREATVVEVHLAEPLPEMPQFARIAVTGRLEFVEDPETMQMFRLMEAKRVPLE